LHILKIFKLLFLFSIFLLQLNAKDLKKITLQLSWFDQFQFAGYYIAKEKGFYEEAGFDVEIKPFEFGINIPKEVSDGKIDFAIGRETLILEKMKNENIVALYALFQATPLILISTKESGINEIDDFKYKKIMTTIDDASEVSLKAMITSHKVRLDELIFLKHSHNINDLINKNTDVISAYISKAPYELEQRKIPFNIFDPKKFGFDMYSDFLYTNQNLINNDINSVIAFKNASLKGWKYAYSNIEESVDLILSKYNSQKLKKDELVYEAKELKKLSYYNTDKLGEINSEKTQRIHDLYNIMGLIETPIDTKNFVLKVDEKKIKANLNLSSKEREYINKKKEVNMCIFPNLKPYSYIENDQLKGFAADFYALIGQNTGLKFKLIKTDSISQSLQYLKEKKCDILSSAESTNDRRTFANFTKPFMDVPFVLITDNKSPFIDNLEVYQNKKIGLVKSYSVNKRIREKYPNIDFVDVNSLDEGIKKVLDGELYGHIDLLHTSWYKLYESDITKLKISGKLDVLVPISIAVRNDDPFLYFILDKAISSISNIEKENILKKWITVEYKKEFDYSLLWQILLVSLIIFLGILYRQKLLKDNNLLLRKKVDIKTKELLEINSELESRIKLEVEENLKKDRLLSQQSKMISMGQMIENIAHQWRQPLSLITTGASGIKIKKQVDDLSDEFLYSTLDSIIETSNYLSNTIDDFRNFYKPEKEKKEFDLGTCCTKTIELMNPKFLEKDIKIIYNTQKLKVNSYENELTQVLINILNNSKDALELNKSISEKLIFISMFKHKKNLIILIRDNAGGIEEEIIDKIYEPYFTTKHNYQGTGIGLYMCQEILTKHMNGKISCLNVEYDYEGKRYKGAEFKIILDII